LHVTDRTPGIRLRWQVQPPARGVVVVGVAADSPGDSGGIRAGDSIERVQDRAVEAVSAYYKVVQNRPGTVELELHGRRRVDP
jgi:S1-C subfamily serine protease